MFCLDVACNLFALTFNVIIFTMMLDGIKTRLNTNKRGAGLGQERKEVREETGCVGGRS